MVLTLGGFLGELRIDNEFAPEDATFIGGTD
jgi:hypothetical protein